METRAAAKAKLRAPPKEFEILRESMRAVDTAGCVPIRVKHSHEIPDGTVVKFSTEGNLIKRSMPADNHCFFHGLIASQLFIDDEGDLMTVQGIRKYIVDFIKKHFTSYGTQLADWKISRPKDLDPYLGDRWGNDLIIQAICDAFQVNIFTYVLHSVHKVVSLLTEFYPKCGDINLTRNIHLLWNGRTHYDFLEFVDEEQIRLSKLATNSGSPIHGKSPLQIHQDPFARGPGDTIPYIQYTNAMSPHQQLGQISQRSSPGLIPINLEYNGWPSSSSAGHGETPSFTPHVSGQVPSFNPQLLMEANKKYIEDIVTPILNKHGYEITKSPTKEEEKPTNNAKRVREQTPPIASETVDRRSKQRAIKKQHRDIIVNDTSDSDHLDNTDDDDDAISDADMSISKEENTNTRKKSFKEVLSSGNTNIGEPQPNPSPFVYRRSERIELAKNASSSQDVSKNRKISMDNSQQSINNGFISPKQNKIAKVASSGNKPALSTSNTFSVLETMEDHNVNNITNSQESENISKMFSAQTNRRKLLKANRNLANKNNNNNTKANVSSKNQTKVATIAKKYSAFENIIAANTGVTSNDVVYILKSNSISRSHLNREFSTDMSFNELKFLINEILKINITDLDQEWNFDNSVHQNFFAQLYVDNNAKLHKGSISHFIKLIDEMCKKTNPMNENELEKGILAVPSLLYMLRGGSDNEQVSILRKISEHKNPNKIILIIIMGILGRKKYLKFGKSIVNRMTQGISDKILLDSIQHYCRNGKLAKLVNQVEAQIKNESIINVDEKNKSSVQLLYPRNNNDWNEEDLGDGIMPITLEQFSILIGTLDKKSAPGLSGWTHNLLDLCLNSEDKDTFIKILYNRFERICTGKYIPQSHLLDSRLILLRKGDGKERPIAIGDAIYRLYATVILNYIQSHAVNNITPIQYGVGISNGIDMLILMQQMFYNLKIENQKESNAAILNLDCKNAFNTISRRAIFEEIKVDYPEILPFFKWAYGNQTEIFDSSCSYAFSCEEGVRQGDPLGPILFAIGLNRALTKFKAYITQQNPDIRIDNIFKIHAYLDDITIFINDIEQWRGRDLFAILQHYLLEIGLEINVRKCKVLISDERFFHHWTDNESFDELNVSAYGFESLGVPIGCNDFIQQKLNEYIKPLTSVMDSGMMQLLPADIRFAIIKYCINSRPLFLIKNIIPYNSMDFCVNFDKKITSLIIDIIKKNNINMKWTATQTMIKHLAMEYQGINIRGMTFLNDAAWPAMFAQAITYFVDNNEFGFDLAVNYVENNKTILTYCTTVHCLLNNSESNRQTTVTTSIHDDVAQVTDDNIMDIDNDNRLLNNNNNINSNNINSNNINSNNIENIINTSINNIDNINTTYNITNDMDERSLAETITAIIAQSTTNCDINSLIERCKGLTKNRSLLNIINSAKDKIINAELVKLLIRNKEVTLLGYKVSLMNNGLKSLPWLLAGLSKTKILSLNEEEYTFNLFKMLLCKHAELRDKTTTIYSCACGMEVDLSLAPDHWASCENAYNLNRFTRHNYCVQLFENFLQNVVKKGETPHLITTEQRIKTQYNNAKEMREKYKHKAGKFKTIESYVIKSIVPDVVLAIDCDVEQSDILDFDYGKNIKSFLFDVSFMHTSQISKVKKLARDLDYLDYRTPYVETLKLREEEKNRKYNQILGESMKTRFMPIVFDMAGGVSEFTYNLLKTKFKDYPIINTILVDDSKYEIQRKWFLKRNAINVAKNNYQIYREYMNANTNKF